MFIKHDLVKKTKESFFAMLEEILSKKECANCRVCCGFIESDKWEIPLIFAENKLKIEEKTGISLEERGSEYVFPMMFDGEKVVFCPAASENGCTLGELKPLDCAIWPFRVNSLGSFRVITVSPVCESVSKLPLKTLCGFLQKNGFAKRLFELAEQHPDMVKPYIEGYPILAVAE